MYISKVNSSFLVVHSGKVEELKSFIKNGELNAKVLEIVKKGWYRLSFSGKLMVVESKSELIPGEILKLSAKVKEDSILLELLNRRFATKNLEPILSFNKKAFNLKELLSQFNSSIDAKNEFPILQYLNTFFPDINWNQDTPYFFWKFQDSEAHSFLGKSGENGIFYMNYNSNKLGRMDIYFQWKVQSLEKLFLTIVLENENTYISAIGLEKLIEGSLLKTGFAEVIINFYLESSKRKENIEWIV